MLFIDGKCALVLIVCLSIVQCGYIPAYFKVCRQSDPNLNQCIVRVAKEVLPHIAKGIPEYGMNPLEPLYVGEVDISKGTGLGLSLQDTVVHGFSQLNFLESTADIPKHHIKIKFSQKLTLTGRYVMDGHVLVVPIKGNGAFNIKIDETPCIYSYVYEPIKKADGRLYSKIANDQLSCAIGKTTFKLENLFGGDKQLGTTVNKLMNDNWQIIMDEFKGPVLKAIQETMKREVNHLYDSIPLDEIIPE